MINLTGDSFLKYVKTLETSQVWVYLGKVGLKLYTPFIYLITKGCDPNKCPSHFIPSADNAPLAVFRELYPKPFSNKLVKNSKQSSKVGRTELTCSSLQY